MGDTPVKCSSCDVQAQVILEEGTPCEVTCPRCGALESYADFQRSLGRQVSAYAADKIGKVFKDVARGNKSVKYIPGHRPPRHSQFKVEFP